MIVIVAPKDDPHARAVAGALARARSPEPFWIDLERAFEDLALEWHADDGGNTWRVTSREKQPVLEPRQIHSIYWRRATAALTSPFLKLPRSENLDAHEIFWSLRWLLEALPEERFPLGHPQSHARAENKHRQLETARQCG